MTEGNTGTVNAAFVVTLSAASSQTVTVQYAIADGTATAGSDYTATSGSLSFAPGQRVQPITVLVTGDTRDEPNETFFVNLTAPTGGATIADAQGLTTITDGTPLTAALVSGPTNGTLTLNPNGSFTYTPNQNFVGTDSFTYRAGDGTATSNVATVSIGVGAVNDPPVAVNDAYAADEDAPLSVAAPGVLADDTDQDGNPLTATLVTGPANGTLVLNPNGSFSYTPRANFTGADTFAYQANDRTANSNTATVTISVGAVNDVPVANDDSYTTTEDTALTVPAPGVLGNDADPEDSPLTAVLVSGPTNGTLALNPNGSFSYTPALNFAGVDSFSYRASDGTASSNVATATITVPLANDPPVVNDDAYSATEDTALTASAPGVLGNDADLENNALTAELVEGPANGTLALNPNGSFSYTPNANFSGVDSFTYQASDGTATSNTATVTITVGAVNDPPIANADTYSANEDTVLTVAARGVLANDTDTEGGALTVELVEGPANGTLILNPDGAFTYTPLVNFVGVDAFTYQANDGTAGSNTATVTITVGPVNDPPVAPGDAYTTIEDATLTVAAPGVLANDTDPEAGPLTAVLVTGPANGTLALNPDGSFSYTPRADFAGVDTFTYQASDGAASSTAATVTITVGAVNDGPVANADSYTVNEDTVLTVAAPGVLANDVDPEGRPLTAVLISGPTNGVLVLNADGSFSYTPRANFTGSDSFTYRADDGAAFWIAADATGAASPVATVTIVVGAVDDAPVASADSYTVVGDTVLTVAAPGVLGNDADLEGGVLTAELVAGPSSGTLSLNADGSFSYRPSSGFAGIDSFTYRARAGAAGSNSATVTIAISAPAVTPPIGAVDGPPVANADAYATVQGTTLTVAAPGVLSNDADPERRPLTAALVGSPANGTLALSSDGSFAYTPRADFVGSDSFTYRANDGTATSAPATVTIAVGAPTVTPPVVVVDGPPVANADAYTTVQGTPLTVPAPGVLSNDADPEGRPLSAIVVSGPANGTLASNPDGSFTYTPRADFVGSDSFTYRANDGTTGSAPATVTIVVGAAIGSTLPPALPVPTGGQLVVSSRVAPSPIRVGDVLTYTITVANNGPGVALLARVVHKLAPGVEFVGAASSTGGEVGFQPAGTDGRVLGRVLIQLGDLAVGATATVTIEVRPTMAGSLGAVSRAKQAPPPAGAPPGPNSQVGVTTRVTER